MFSSATRSRFLNLVALHKAWGKVSKLLAREEEIHYCCNERWDESQRSGLGNTSIGENAHLPSQSAEPIITPQVVTITITDRARRLQAPDYCLRAWLTPGLNGHTGRPGSELWKLLMRHRPVNAVFQPADNERLELLMECVGRWLRDRPHRCLPQGFKRTTLVGNRVCYDGQAANSVKTMAIRLSDRVMDDWDTKPSNRNHNHSEVYFEEASCFWAPVSSTISLVMVFLSTHTCQV